MNEMKEPIACEQQRQRLTDWSYSGVIYAPLSRFERQAQIILLKSCFHLAFIFRWQNSTKYHRKSWRCVVWIFKYLVCLVRDHIWVGSRYRYCLRCGKLELVNDNEPVPVTENEILTLR